MSDAKALGVPLLGSPREFVREDRFFQASPAGDMANAGEHVPTLGRTQRPGFDPLPCARDVGMRNDGHATTSPAPGRSRYACHLLPWRAFYPCRNGSPGKSCFSLEVPLTLTKPLISRFGLGRVGCRYAGSSTSPGGDGRIGESLGMNRGHDRRPRVAPNGRKRGWRSEPSGGRNGRRSLPIQPFGDERRRRVGDCKSVIPRFKSGRRLQQTFSP